ncbi:MAG: amino acid adenylation domain-containing protein, partial [Giesbergeria sp.]
MHDNPATRTAMQGESGNQPTLAEASGLHRLIEAQVARTPQLEALRFDGRSFSYAQLDQRANQLAHYLRELGVGPDTIVGVFMERSLELVVALVAILKAGGAYLPLDTCAPAARLQFMLDDADVPVVLTQQSHATRLEAFAGTVLPLDSKADYLANYPQATPQDCTGPQDLAYVIYTSGSTGQPKGCLLAHGAICNRLVWMQDAYGLGPGDRVLQKTPYTFDVSVWEFFWPLLAGATLVLAAPQGHKDSHYQIQLIRSEGITVCHFVPSMLRFFLDHADVGRCTSLRHVFTSGEALSIDLVQRFRTLLPARLHNLYGPTEAAVDVSAWECEVRADRQVPIGRAIRNIRLYILDAERQPVPRGVEGELHIAGAGLARGYLRRPQLTAERFIDDPFHPGQRMYRTGDRVVELDDGNIGFLGRVDFQVKLRGLRIELGEIETLLRRYEGVREAAVLVRGEEDGDPKLVAYVEAAAALDATQVRRFLATQLPDYMVPSLVVALAQLPVTVHGKLDRAALPWPLAAADAVPAVAMAASAHHGGEPGGAAPEAVQTRIAQIVAGLLRQGKVAADADLFDLGATSLTLMRVAEQIRKEFEVVVPLDVFLDNPTVASVGAYVAQEGAPAAPAQGGQAAGAAATALGDIALPSVAYRADACIADGRQISFSGAAVPLEAFSAWLGLLVAGTGEDGAKYRYPSGGGLNPVRTYVYLNGDGVPGLPCGAYYHQPEDHVLYRVGTSAALAASVFGSDAERFEKAALAVFFVAEMDAVEPLYRQAAATLVTLEAGYMSQLLLSAQHAHGVAAVAATQPDFDLLVPAFGLAPTERFVHCLLVGTGLAGMAAAPGGAPLAAASYGAQGCVRHDDGQAVFASQAQASITSEQLARERRHLRRMPAGAPNWALAKPAFAWPEYHLRASCRDYGPQSVDVGQLGRLLGMLRGLPGNGSHRRLCGAVDPSRDLVVYVHLRGTEVPQGLYRYDAPTHRLVAVGSLTAAQLEQVYTPYNRRHFKQSSLGLFIFGRLDASLGRQVALHAALLDAGCLGQLLMERQAEFGLGLCPIGAIRFEPVQQAFHLAPGMELLHSFVGG